MAWSWELVDVLVLLVLSWNLLTQLQRFNKSAAILVKYLAIINNEDFYADEETNMFASHKYSVITPLFCRLLSVYLQHLHL